MYCGNCKAEIEDTMLFCWSCGTPLSEETIIHKEKTHTAEKVESPVQTERKHEPKESMTDEQIAQQEVTATVQNEANIKQSTSDVQSPSEERYEHERIINMSTIEPKMAESVENISVSSFSGQVKDTFLHATERINRMVGEEGQIDLQLRDVFSNVFKKHSKQDAEKLFITGTELTTPKEEDIPTSWPKPWLFSRIFIVFAITYFFLSISAHTFENINAIPGLIVIGSFAVPFSLLIFFWETNAPRNISIYEVAKMFFIGGAASLVTTLVIYSVFPLEADLTYGGAIVIGIVEEVGKLVIIAYFIYQQNSKYILNGLLIGAAIGAGFAAFESAGYAFTFGLLYDDSVMTEVIFSRAWLAIGAHTVWSAIAGGALVYVKGAKQLTNDMFFNPKFFQLFAVPIILHAVWDMPLYALHRFYFLYIVLIVIAWIFIFTFINAGLKQIVRLHRNAQ